MTQKTKQLLHDITFLVIIILVVLYLLQAGVFDLVFDQIKHFGWLGIVLSGIFFTSIFTTLPSLILLGEFIQTEHILTIAFFGAFGAMIGDYIIFHFVKSRISEDVEYVLTFSRTKRLKEIFKTKLFKFFVPFIGALVIASPLPDELGITMMGLTDMKSKKFLAISFVLNGLGIFFILWTVNAVVHNL